MSGTFSNPYVPGSSVGGMSAFVGRAATMDSLWRAIEAGRPGAILYGQRRVGKSSILGELASRLRQEGRVPVEWDGQDKSALRMPELISGLAQAAARALGLAEPSPLPSTIPLLRTWLAGLPTARCVFLMDEVDVVTNHGNRGFIKEVLSLHEGDLLERVAFVVVIGRTLGELDVLASGPLGGLTPVPVSFLDRGEVDALVQMDPGRSGLDWEPGAVDEIWRLACGHPLLTQHLCYATYERARRATPAARHTVNATEVIASVEHALSGAGTMLDSFWTALKPMERLILAALAPGGSAHVGEIERKVGESMPAEARKVRDALARLEDRELVHRQGNALGFRVELIRVWVRRSKAFERVREEATPPEEKRRRQIAEARELLEDGSVQDAAAAFETADRILQSDPTHSGAIKLRAEVMARPDAVAILEILHGSGYQRCRDELERKYTSLADASPDDDARLRYYEKARRVAGDPRVWDLRIREMWRARGEAAWKENRHLAAAEAFDQAGDTTLGAQARTTHDQLRAQARATARAAVHAAYDRQQRHDFQDALRCLDGVDPADADISADTFNELKRRLEEGAAAELALKEAASALDAGRNADAVRALGRVLACDPAWPDAVDLMERATGSESRLKHATQRADSASRRNGTLEQELSRQRRRLRWVAGIASCGALIVGVATARLVELPVALVQASVEFTAPRYTAPQRPRRGEKPVQTRVATVANVGPASEVWVGVDDAPKKRLDWKGDRYTGKVEVTPGRHSYVLVVGGGYQLDGKGCEQLCPGPNCHCCLSCSGEFDAGGDEPLGCLPVTYGFPEVCDPYGTDENCDGHIGEDDGQNWYLDEDGDGAAGGKDADQAVPCNGTSASTQPKGLALVKDADCNDLDPEVHPGALEVDNGKDDDCDSDTPDATAEQAHGAQTLARLQREIDAATRHLSECNGETQCVRKARQALKELYNRHSYLLKSSQ